MWYFSSRISRQSVCTHEPAGDAKMHEKRRPDWDLDPLHATASLRENHKLQVVQPGQCHKQAVSAEAGQPKPPPDRFKADAGDTPSKVMV